MTEELEYIKPKVLRGDIDFTETELQCLTEVYKQIGILTNQQNKLDRTCSGCIRNAIMIVKNYINQQSNIKPLREDAKERVLESMTLKELREIYPDIKKRSKSDFIKEVNASKGK